MSVGDFCFMRAVRSAVRNSSEIGRW